MNYTPQEIVPPGSPVSLQYRRHSPSKLNKAASCLSMFIVEEFLGMKQIVGVPAYRGTAVEDGVTYGLKNPDALLRECVEVANAKYDTLAAMSGDARREKYRNNMPDMIFMALKELRPYGVPSETQGIVEWRPEGLSLPIVGYFDFKWEDRGIINDLKTTEQMPGQIKISHARQVSLYTAENNLDALLTYTTPKKCQTYQLENIKEHRRALYNIAKSVENLMALSDDPEFFLTIIPPDLESFYWGNPASRQLAFELWKI